MLRNPRTYEHIPPESVGNRRKILVSEQAGRSNVIHRAKEMGIEIDPQDPRLFELVQKIKEAENYGYQYEGADASFEILLRNTLGEDIDLFSTKGFRVIVEKREEGETVTEATVKLEVEDEIAHTVAEGDGPVHALDNALRKALKQYFPHLERMKLTDYKVRVLNEKEGTAAKIRVLIQTSDGEKEWGTVGVSTNIIEASWNALIDSIKYGLWKAISQKKH